MRLGGRGTVRALAPWAGCAAILAGAGAAAASTSVETFPPEPQLAGGVFVRGDDSGNAVSIGYRAKTDEFTVRDSRRNLKLRPGDTGAEPCRLVATRVARCPNPSRSAAAAAVTVRLRGGEDLLISQEGFATPIAVNGGTGIDEIHGNAGDDVIVGGPGADILRGHDGDDNLTGRRGDELYADDGDDVILADYGDRERLIDCGPGEDRAFVDSADVETVGCETVEER